MRTDLIISDNSQVHQCALTQDVVPLRATSFSESLRHIQETQSNWRASVLTVALSRIVGLAFAVLPSFGMRYIIIYQPLRDAWWVCQIRTCALSREILLTLL